jgi:phage tail sheath protein FI
MAYQLSPGVNWSEIDLTTIVPSVSTTVGALAGDFDWGPINEIRAIGSELELVRYFGKPSANTSRAFQAQSFFTAANFLGYAQSLMLVRAANTVTAKNSSSGSSPILIRNKDDYELNHVPNIASGLGAVYGMFAARYAGDLGNSIKVSLWASANATAFSSWEYAGEFSSVPRTSTYASQPGINAANDEMHIVVVDANGSFGVSNSILEKYSFLSKAVDAKNDDGSSNYYVNVINDQSEFIYILHHALDSTGNTDTSTWGLVASNTTFAQGNNHYTKVLSGGALGTPTNGDLVQAYDKFVSTEETDVSLIMTGGAGQTVSEHIVDNIAEVRKDCVAFISPLYEDAVNNDGLESTDIATYRNDFNSSSYAFMDSGWKKQFDKYNNIYRWIPLNGDIAGLCARTDFERDPWFSPAGFNRGQVKNVVKLSWNPTKAERDILYKAGVNPVVNFKGEGTVLYGDKTLLAKPSAFDRINVRRLFIVLEKAIAKAAKYSLFEFNDEFTRAQFVALVEPYLRDIKGRRGIFDFRVVCDETNNTPEVVDRNEFVGDIYIKPARSINFIQLNFVAVRTGVAFSEVVGKF